MTTKELQEEELEVLKSIYDGDQCFKILDDTSFQYQIGEDGDPKSLVLGIKWGENYPEDLPTIELGAFYNQRILSYVKESISKKLLEEGEPFLGCAMTYTLFEYAKENVADLMTEQPDGPIGGSTYADTQNNDNVGAKKERKEQLTKNQKRRLYDKFGMQQVERPRGWDWVDIIKHLSSTGGQGGHTDS